MNNRLKAIVCIFLILSLFSLTACGKSGGGGGTPTPQTLNHLTAVRLSVATIVNNISGIIGFTPSSYRASENSISISEKMGSLAYGNKINKIIPCNTANDFKTGNGPNGETEWIQNSRWLVGTDQDLYNRLAIGTCEKYEENTRYNVALYEGKEGAGSYLTKIVALPTENTAVAISYLDDGNGNKSTLVFIVNKKGEFQGRTYDGIKDDVTYNSGNYTSVIYGDKKQGLTYANDDIIETVKFDGTSVTSSTPLIEGFKSCLCGLKFIGQLRTGLDHQSDSPIIIENKLDQLPQDLKYLGIGKRLDQYMKYSTIEDFIHDADIINQFMPDDLEDYENVRIGDYNGTLDYYYGPLATLRLALSVINKDNAKIITKVAGQDDGLYIVSISYLTINGKEYTAAIGAQMIKDSEGIFLEAKLFEGKRDNVNYLTTDGAIGTAVVEYKSETEIPGTITVNGKTITFNGI